MTHEEFIQSVREAVALRQSEPERSALRGVKISYGAGDGSYHGICHHNAWQQGTRHSFVEIAATGEESPIQLAGTTVHELGHTLCAPGVGHSLVWKQACGALGLHNASAVGQAYKLTDFDPTLRFEVEKLITQAIDDGTPNFSISPLLGTGLLRGLTVRPCPMGIGAHGGKSRGKGSGSRLRLWECACNPPIKARVCSDKFTAHCDMCSQPFAFKRAIESLPSPPTTATVALTTNDKGQAMARLNTKVGAPTVGLPSSIVGLDRVQSKHPLSAIAQSKPTINAPTDIAKLERIARYLDECASLASRKFHAQEEYDAHAYASNLIHGIIAKEESNEIHV